MIDNPLASHDRYEEIEFAGMLLDYNPENPSEYLLYRKG